MGSRLLPHHKGAFLGVQWISGIYQAIEREWEVLLQYGETPSCTKRLQNASTYHIQIVSVRDFKCVSRISRQKTMILSTERVSIESECSFELSACREVSINQPSKDKMFFSILRMSTESKYPYATISKPCTHSSGKQFCIYPSYFQPPLVKAGRALNFTLLVSNF